MELLSGILTKPVLIGLHLGFGILGIDAFIWYFGEIIAGASNGHKRIKIASVIGAFSFLASWIFGGYYYVTYYGNLVKPVIKSGMAPWAHNIIMETKEHIFLFLIPLSITAFLLTFIPEKDFKDNNMKGLALALTGLIVFIGLSIGLMGYIISAAARWG
ncbi:hypothetical protein HYT00_02245 [Candidatus Giovannonibacteria bacterium]|nr:hypothetical protein [Candidatus Giovannonibacteria bacterium]